MSSSVYPDFSTDVQLCLDSQTPDSNTGSNLQPAPASPSFTGLDYGIDALTFLWSGDSNMLELVSTMLDVRFDFTRSTERRVGVLWHRTYLGSFGCMYLQRDTRDGCSHRLVLSGSSLCRFPTSHLHRFLQMVVLSTDTIRCSRLDIRCDDFGSLLQFERIERSLREGNYAGFSSSRVIVNHGSRTPGGWTVYLGSRQSEHFVRIYNKAAESHGSINSVRWESEFKGDKADYIFRAIAGSDSADPKLLARWLLGRVDFVNKTSVHLDRCDRLDWFAAFVAALDACQLAPVVLRSKSSIESKIAWIKRQVANSLALVNAALGSIQMDVFLDDMIQESQAKFKRYQHLIIDEYLASVSTVCA